MQKIILPAPGAALVVLYCFPSSVVITSLIFTAPCPLYCAQPVQGLVVASLCLQCNVYHMGHRLFWLESHTGPTIFVDQLSIWDQDCFAFLSHGLKLVDPLLDTYLVVNSSQGVVT